MAAKPTLQLAEALRMLANAAYGDPDAPWENPQQLVTDALRQAKVLQITPDMVTRMLQHHESVFSHPYGMFSSDTPDDPARREAIIDRWVIGMLTAAFEGTEAPTVKMKPLFPLKFSDVAMQQFDAGDGTITFHFLVKGNEVAARVLQRGSAMGQASERENAILNAAASITMLQSEDPDRNEMWLKHIHTIFGDEIQQYLDRLNG